MCRLVGSGFVSVRVQTVWCSVTSLEVLFHCLLTLALRSGLGALVCVTTVAASAMAIVIFEGGRDIAEPTGPTQSHPLPTTTKEKGK